MELQTLRRAQVMEDLEDYFHRVDARRAEIEAEMATDGERKGKHKHVAFVFEFRAVFNLHM